MILAGSTILLCVAVLGAVSAGGAPASPEIRTSDTNRVPACVTPEYLMRYVETRNNRLDKRYASLADLYRQHGEQLRVRWDYAFYQMLLETNFLLFGGDVSPKQNNFAGLGATGGGVPGDRFPDVATGVLAQMQHLVAYSGERVASPVSARTREKQDDIIAASTRLNRPVRFADLTRRWAADSKYMRSIEVIADGYRSRFCPAAEIAKAGAATPPVRRASVERRPEPAPNEPSCNVWTASYGGTAAALIRSAKDGREALTVLVVPPGEEARLAAAYVASHAPGGETVATFPTREEALREAFTRCPAP